MNDKIFTSSDVREMMGYLFTFPDLEHIVLPTTEINETIKKWEEEKQADDPK